MFSRTAFISRRTPPVPEAFPKSTTAGENQKGKDKEGATRLSPYTSSPETSRASETATPTRPQLADSVAEASSGFTPMNASRTLPEVPAEVKARYEALMSSRTMNEAPSSYNLPRPQFADSIAEGSSASTAVDASRNLPDLSAAVESAILAQTGARYVESISSRARRDARAHYMAGIKEHTPGRAEPIRSIAAEESRRDETIQSPTGDGATDLERETLAIKVGAMHGEDLEDFLIYPMLDIEHKDQAMITRVKDLLGPSEAGEEVVIGEPFIAHHPHSMAILDHKSLCAILVTTRGHRGKVRVTDRANLKRLRARWHQGYEEVDVKPTEAWGSLVVIVKRGQQAVVEGKPTLRLFARVKPGTAADVASETCEDPWTYRRIVGLPDGVLWHDFLIEEQH